MSKTELLISTSQNLLVLYSEKWHYDLFKDLGVDVPKKHTQLIIFKNNLGYQTEKNKNLEIKQYFTFDTERNSSMYIY